MAKIADSDGTITDPNTGLEHKVFAGQPVPGHLLSDEEREQYEVIGSGPSQPSGVIADSDEEREDPNTGLTHKVFAGQPIPPFLLTEEEQQQEQSSPEGQQPQPEAPQSQEEDEDDEEEPQKPQAVQRKKIQRRPDRER